MKSCDFGAIDDFFVRIGRLKTWIRIGQPAAIKAQPFSIVTGNFLLFQSLPACLCQMTPVTNKSGEERP
jgi:hypothetical protein